MFLLQHAMSGITLFGRFVVLDVTVDDVREDLKGEPGYQRRSRGREPTSR